MTAIAEHIHECIITGDEAQHATCRCKCGATAPNTMGDMPEWTLPESDAPAVKTVESLGPAGLQVAQLRNALMILNAAGHRLHQVASMVAGDAGPLEIGFRSSDVADLRRLLTEAIALSTSDYHELQLVRKNLDRALADRRRLELAIAAPKVRSITRILVDDAAGTPTETLVAALSDGSVLQYWPTNAPGDRWRDLEPVPASSRAVLAEAVA